MDKNRLITVILSLLVTACQSTSAFNAYQIDETADLVQTWQKGLVALPNTSEITVLEETQWPLGSSLPAMIYLHGCTGLGKGDRALMQKIAQLGVAVIAPNSMARSYRPLQCNPEDQTGGYHFFVYAMREAELAFAVYQLEQLPWVDKRQMMLAGGSEGAVTAALYRGNEFKSRVLLQWTCHGAPYIAGLAAGPDERVLALVNGADPWYQHRMVDQQVISQLGNCGDFDQYNHVTSHVLPYEGHDLLQDAQAVGLILTFLKDTRVR